MKINDPEEPGALCEGTWGSGVTERLEIMKHFATSLSTDLNVDGFFQSCVVVHCIQYTFLFVYSSSLPGMLRFHHQGAS